MKVPVFCLLFFAPPSFGELPPRGREPRETIRLDGEWLFRRDGQEEWKSVRVPSSFESHQGPEFDGIGWYKRKVSPQSIPAGRRTLLHFQAAATHAEVSWNGKKLGSHLGGWTPFRFDVTGEIRGPEPEGGHEILVRLDEKVGHNTQGFLPIIAPHFGGIWRGVNLLVVSDPYFDDLNLMAMGNPETGNIEVEVPLGGAVDQRIGVVFAGYRLLGEDSWKRIPAPVRQIEAVLRFSLRIPEFRTWSCWDPSLYEIEIALPSPGEGLPGDLVRTRAAFRKVEASGEKILLNGVPIGVRGLLNWGYYPPENFPNPGEKVFRKDLEFARSAGFNLMKFCLWVPPERYLDLADEMGVLTWMEYPTWHPRLTQEHLADLVGEFSEFFAYDRNHPSVILRSLTCETGPGADLKVIRRLYDLAHRMVPGALVEDDSSWIGWNRIHDFYDDHPYGNNHTWLPTLHRLKDHIKERRILPLILGEAMAADTWVEQETLRKRAGGARPFWVPGFFDEAAKWEDHLRGTFGPEGIDRLLPDSLRYGMLMRKYQVEAFRREIPSGGYVISVIRDFSLASMGLLDYQGEPKWSPADWAWQGDTMCLLATENDRRSFHPEEMLLADLFVSHFGRRAIDGGRLVVALEGPERDGVVLDRLEFKPLDLECGNLFKATGLKFSLPRTPRPERLVVRAHLKTELGDFRNSWPIWVVPRPGQRPPLILHESVKDEAAKDLLSGAPRLGAEKPKGIVAASRFDGRLVEILEEGGSVLLLPDGERGSLPRSAHWFLRGAPYIPVHALSAKIPRDLLVELQHFDLASDVIPEVNYLDEIDPILLLWDTHDLKKVKTHGLIFETGAGGGRLLVTALRHTGTTNAAGRWLLSALLDHLAAGPVPKRSFRAATWRRLQEKLHEEKIDLVQETWKFRSEGTGEGVAKDWHLPGLALDDNWKEIRIGRAWEAQGYPALDGWAWYRISIRIPAGWAGREIYLSFEGVDDIYELFVNGKLAGKGGDLKTRQDAFNEKKSHRITSFVRPGEKCLIAVRVHDWYGAGGIFRPVSLGTVGFFDGPEVLRP